MRIALIGYGKMGKTIERIAIERGHTISHLFDSKNPFENSSNCDADVAVEFTQPDRVVQNIQTAFAQNLPIVVGTTAWQSALPEVQKAQAIHQGSLLHASNFSLGVNLFQSLVSHLAKLISPYPEYAIEIEEIHHTQKLDSPSGTAISIAENILQNNVNYQSWQVVESETDLLQNDALPITAQRIENVPGTHRIHAKSKIDTLSLEHVAHSRDGFALGAVLAAEWLQGKKGIFTMQDVLQLNH
jgi:4-hydroxy-tetrahydrodipicolinate reductase